MRVKSFEHWIKEAGDAAEISNSFNNLVNVSKVSKLTHPEALISMVKDSKSQIGQDLWVANHLNLKREGFFVEVGAFDGMNLSNTWLLENSLDWKGIVIEPSYYSYSKARVCRNCLVVNKFISNESNSEVFF